MRNSLLLLEIRRLQRALDTIRDCTDRKCSLCGSCLDAVATPRSIVPPPPDIGPNDPVRTFRDPRGRAVAR